MFKPQSILLRLEELQPKIHKFQAKFRSQIMTKDLMRITFKIHKLSTKDLNVLF